MCEVLKPFSNFGFKTKDVDLRAQLHSCSEASLCPCISES